MQWSASFSNTHTAPSPFARVYHTQRKSDLAAGGSELTATALPDAVSSVDAAAVGLPG